jgi:REP element-mobilizing transposase RayT
MYGFANRGRFGVIPGLWHDRFRIEYPGAVYHVTCRGNNRQTIYRDDRDRRRYLEKLSLYCQEKKVDLLAYCLMSNHVHLLVETPEGISPR